ncbi:topless-related protein 3-like [Castanea sativa]|uniref:topless-related protein 3-like n=1 Tax=Castanea sativa TaxID=21020 RepID=UPI003F651960
MGTERTKSKWKGVNLEESVPCIALSKNDSYVMSTCGGKVSLFNMMTFKVMTTFMPASPAIGMEDSTILVHITLELISFKVK